MIRTTIFSLAVLCFDWRIGLIFLLGMLLFLWVNSLLLKKSRELSPGRLAAQTRLVDAVLEYIQGMSVVRAFHGDKAANQTLNRTIEETEQQNFKLERKRIPYNVLEQIVLRVTAVVAILLSIWFFLQGSMTLFTCLMVVVSAFLVYSELASAGEMFFMLPMIDASIDRVEEIDCAPRMDEGGSVQTPKHCDISFEHVDFSYGERKIIRDVSFTIPEGTTTAIVGPSGSGKTTLTSLMARFWDVDSGAVKLGGIDVKDYALDSLMRNFSMVFQRVYLFNDSIENNIKFGKPDATHEEVVAAAKAARCHDFITALPDAYDTIIGESGATISGGERQRLSIARAMLKDAPIIILDEATANVDPENEAELQEAYDWLVQCVETMDTEIVTDEIIDNMAQGRKALGLIYSGDASYVMAENPDMGYYMPESGTNLWSDAMVIPKNAKNPELAHAFINYASEYDGAYDNSSYVGYTSANQEVMDALSGEGGDYEGINAYIPRTDNENDEVFVYNEDTKKIISDLWSRVKIAASNAG